MTEAANKFRFEDEDDVLMVKPGKSGTAVLTKEEAEEAAPVRTAKLSKGKPVNNVALAKQAIAKLNSIESELNTILFEREAQIRDMMRALASGKHILLLGPPGTAKSLLSREFAKRIVNANYFEWLLNRTSDPAEILGPYSIKAMEKDQFKRVPKGKLPEAHVAFLDEIYKCNEPTLNIMLPILNEGIWFNDGVAEETNIRLVVAASNEEPDDDSLEALHDRLVFRHWVDYVKDTKNRIDMMKGAVTRRNPNLNSNNQMTTITLDEIDALRGFVDTVDVPDAVIKTFEKLLRELDKKSIRVSDRRVNAAVHIMQAEAALNNRDKVTVDDLQALVYVLWEKKDDIKEIEAEVLKLVNPYDSEVKKLFDKALEIRDKTMAITNKTERAGASVDAKDNLSKLVAKLDKVIKDAQANGKDVTAFQKKRAEIIKINDEIIASCLGLVGSANSTGDAEMPF